MSGPRRVDEQLRRHIEPIIQQELRSFRVIIVNGPRQSGKSTLLRRLHAELGGGMRDLDGDALLQAALTDPTAFVSVRDRWLFIDEVQRGGDPLIRAIKQRVDDPANTTTFVLAGSSNFLTVPVLAESLAGRAVISEVWPFSQGERAGRIERFLDRLVSVPEELMQIDCPRLSRTEYLDRVVGGGFPEPLGLPQGRLRSAWFRSYVQTVTQRDIREFSGIRQIEELPRLLRFLAGSTAAELVKTRLAQAAGMDRNTVGNYLPLLQTVYLIRELPAWSRNPLGKVTRHPKVFVSDTGLAASLQGVTAESLEQPVAPLRGPFVETFVHNEMVKQRTWSDAEVNLHHWRDRAGAEVDLVVEELDGRVSGIVCKAALTVRSEDFRWLRVLQAKLGSRFGHGVVFYLGQEPLSFGPGMTALPLSALWA